MTRDGQTIEPDNETNLPSGGDEPAGATEPPTGSAGILGGSADVRHVSLVILTLLAVLYTLHLAAVFFLPIVVAILLNLLLSPMVRLLCNHLRIPEPLGAGIVILVFLGVLGFGAYRLTPAASAWVARAPESLATLQRRIQPLRRPMERVSRAAEQVEQATDMDKTQEVEIKGPSLSKQVYGGTTALLSSGMVVIFLTYFLLASGQLFLQKLVGVLPHLKDKKTAVRIVRETEAQVSTYLVVTTLINVGVGVATGAALALLGMPNAVLWGVIAAVLNFVPYIGGLVNTVILALAALLAFEDTGQALMVPIAFTVINILEGNLITPWILGRRMRLNTVAVFVGLVFWWFLWGIPGAILAVPMLATIKIACDHIESLRPIGEFLAE